MIDPEGKVEGRLTSLRQGPLVVSMTLLVTSMVVGVLLLQVYHRVRIVDLGYQMTELTEERRRLMEERERLRIEAAVSTRTERLDKVARETLGLRPYRPNQVLKVQPTQRASRGDAP
jgi:cell division protein FtsL